MSLSLAQSSARTSRKAYSKEYADIFKPLIDKAISTQMETFIDSEEASMKPSTLYVYLQDVLAWTATNLGGEYAKLRKAVKLRKVESEEGKSGVLIVFKHRFKTLSSAAIKTLTEEDMRTFDPFLISKLLVPDRVEIFQTEVRNWLNSEEDDNFEKEFEELNEKDRIWLAELILGYDNIEYNIEGCCLRMRKVKI